MVFWTVLGLGRLRNSGPGPKTEKHNFLVLEALWQEAKGRKSDNMADYISAPFFLLLFRA